MFCGWALGNEPGRHRPRTLGAHPGFRQKAGVVLVETVVGPFGKMGIIIPAHKAVMRMQLDNTCESAWHRAESLHCYF